MMHMKIAIMAALLLIAAHSFAEDWSYLKRDEKVNHFQINAKGKLQYDGQIIESFVLQQTADRIGISPASPDGKYLLLLSFGDQDSQLSLFNIQRRTTKVVPLQGTPIVWNSWSPDSSYLLLSTYSDAENALYVLTLNSDRTSKVPVQLHKAGEKLELDTTTVMWTAPDTFHMEAFIYCASGSEGCDSQSEEKPVRMYRLTVNAGSLQVTPEEQPLPQDDM
jgi:uncharacterized protein with WD repeat